MFARPRLDEAARLLETDQTTDRLFVEKWRGIAWALASNDPRPIQEFRMRALEFGHWESVRECDYFLVRLTGDARLFHHLYFGTPFPAYRARLKVLLPMDIPEEFELGQGGNRLDLADARWQGRPIVPPGKKLHQTLVLMFRDFYRPITTGALFSSLFPDEKYLFHYSPLRVHQIVFRLRQELAAGCVPLSIAGNEGHYRFHLDGPLTVRVPLNLKPSEKDELMLTQLAATFAGSAFTAREARDKLSLPLTTMQRLLKSGIESRRVRQLGAGPATRYLIYSKAS